MSTTAQPTVLAPASGQVDVAGRVRRNSQKRELSVKTLREVGATRIQPVQILQKLFPEERPRTLAGMSQQFISGSGKTRWARTKAAAAVVAVSPALLGSGAVAIWAHHVSLISGGWLTAALIAAGLIWIGILGRILESLTGKTVTCSAALVDAQDYKGVVPGDGLLAIQRLQEMPDLVFQVATRSDKQIVTRKRSRDPLLLVRHLGTGEIWLLEAWDIAPDLDV